MLVTLQSIEKHKFSSSPALAIWPEQCNCIYGGALGRTLHIGGSELGGLSPVDPISLRGNRDSKRSTENMRRRSKLMTSSLAWLLLCAPVLAQKSEQGTGSGVDLTTMNIEDKTTGPHQPRTDLIQRTIASTTFAFEASRRAGKCRGRTFRSVLG